MSYQTQTQLTNDAGFLDRTHASLTEQSLIFINDARADFIALANVLLTGALVNGVSPIASFTRILAGAPGFAETVDNGDGTIDSTRVTDDDIRAAVQAQYPTVAALFYNSDGTPK